MATEVIVIHWIAFMQSAYRQLYTAYKYEILKSKVTEEIHDSISLFISNKCFHSSSLMKQKNVLSHKKQE